MTHQMEFGVIKKGTIVFFLKDDEITSGTVNTNKIIVDGYDNHILNQINIGTEDQPIWVLVEDDNCYFSKEELIKSL